MDTLKPSEFDRDKKIDSFRLVSLATRPSMYIALFPLEEFLGVYYINWGFVFVSIVVFVVYLVMTVYVKIIWNTGFEEVKFNDYLNGAQTLFMLCLPIVSVYRLLTTLCAFNENLRVLQDIEVRLANFGQRLQRESNCGILCLEVLFLFGTILFRIVKNYFEDISLGDTMLFTVYYSCLVSSMYCLAHRYTCILRVYKQLFGLCNRAIGLCSAVDRDGHLNSIALVHSNLCSVSAAYSALEMPQIFLILLTSFIISVSEFYKALALIWKDADFQFLAVGIKLSWVGLGSILIWRIVSSCSSCSNEAKQFTTLLYELMLENGNEDICNNKKLRLHIAMKREVVFTACEFFVIDFTLIHSMLAAATTYLVVLIQFSEPVIPTFGNATSPAPVDL